MARGVNKVILVGNLGSDPDVRYGASGSAVTNISIATSESWKDKKTNEPQERTTWHRVTLFSRLGEIAAEYCNKGSQVYIEGSLRTDKFTDPKTGQDKYSTSIIANNLQLLGNKGDAQNDQSSQSSSRPSDTQRVAEGEEIDPDIPF